MIEARSLIALIALLLVVLLVLLNTNSTSPGSLSLVHAAEPSLQSVNSCTECHGHLLQSMTEACYECHESTEQQINDATGFHGQLLATDATDCARCHSEHHGSGLFLVSERSFIEAGFDGGREAYDHRGLGYELTGVHATLSCNHCHEYADARVVPLGSQRFVGPDQTCTTCHEDSHEGDYGTDCASCHGQTAAFEEVGGWAHDTFAPLVGAHAQTECLSCHEEGSQWSVQALAEQHVALGGTMAGRRCDDCHESAHSDRFLAQVDLDFGTLADGLGCQHCHLPDDDGFLGEVPAMTPELHGASGFPLDAPHDQASCLDCHLGFGTRQPLDDAVAERAAFLESFPGRGADTCSACHEDVHDGQFDDGPFAGQECLACHERTSFAPTAFDVEHHERTDFPLAGTHAATECDACHPLADDTPRITGEGLVTRQFAGIAEDCSACHETPHQGNFLDGVQAILGLDLDEDSCAACHDAGHETFLGDNGTHNTELHIASGFALQEPHHELSCEDCHAGFGTRPDELSADAALTVYDTAFPGRDARTCQQCHTDPHKDQFLDGRFAGEDCLSCHDALAFRPPAFGFDHHDLTDFPLTGSHQAVGCDVCHIVPDGMPALTDDGLLTRVFQETPTDCEACHVNVHEDYFDRPGLPAQVDGQAGCARCHTTETFQDRRFDVFDHALWAGYELVGAHSRASCDGCHLTERDIDPPRLVFGDLRGEDCSSCHVDSHVGQFTVDGVTDCTRCHQIAEQFSDLVFDHQTDSRFVPDEAHVLLSCDACHVPYGLTNGQTAVRYRPLGVECSDCHDPTDLQYVPPEDER